MKQANRLTSLLTMIKNQQTRLSLKRCMAIAALSVAAFSMSSAQAVEVAKLLVSKTGMQRVTYEQLLEQGIDLHGLRVVNLFVKDGDEFVPVRVEGQKRGKRRFFGRDGFIDFYANSADSLYTTSKAYSLHYLSNRQRRAITRDPSNNVAIKADRTRANASDPAITVYTHTQEVEQDSFYDFAAPSSTDPWHYGQNFSIFPTPSYPFELDQVVGGTNTAEIDVEMYGLLDFPIEGNDHHYEVLVNDIVVGDQQFDGNSVDQFSAQNVVVNEGENAFKYNYRAIQGVPFDIVTLNRFTVRYPRYTVAENGYLEGAFSTGLIGVSAIQADDFAVYRVEGETVTQLSGAVKSGDEVRFTNTVANGKYVVVGDGSQREVVVKPLLRKRDIRSGPANYLIITHQSLMGDALDELVELRSQTYSVKVVDVAQIYAQFGTGVVDSQPIYDYIKFAYANMDTTHAVIIGNDSYDYKQLATDSVSLIPTRYVTTPGGQLIVTQTPSDASYGDMNGDTVPEIPVGRISVRNQAELQAVVNKLKAYEAGQGYAGRVLVAADKEDNGNGISFTQDAEALIAAMPKTWRDSVRSDFRAFPDIDVGQLAHEKTLRAINAGVRVVNFIGHSSHRRWSFSTPPMLLSNQISQLTNVGKPAIVTQWGCWNSYYVDPAGNTMADEFLLAGENGAATVLGASTLTTSTGERALGVELNKRMYDQGITIGEAVVQAKRALAQRENYPAIQLGWQIIGDPALMVNP